jgi:hypothetical protein
MSNSTDSNVALLYIPATEMQSLFENILQKTGTLDYENLVNIKQEDFSYFTGDDFVNIIGSEDIKLYTS